MDEASVVVVLRLVLATRCPDAACWVRAVSLSAMIRAACSRSPFRHRDGGRSTRCVRSWRTGWIVSELRGVGTRSPQRTCWDRAMQSGHLLSLLDLDRPAFDLLIADSFRWKAGEGQPAHGNLRRVATIFDGPAFRTRLAFDAALSNLGVHQVPLQVRLGERESSLHRPGSWGGGDSLTNRSDLTSRTSPSVDAA